MEKHLNDLETVGTHDEFDQKMENISRFGFSLSNWMNMIFNRDNEEEFNPVWLSVSVLCLVFFCLHTLCAVETRLSDSQRFEFAIIRITKNLSL